MRPPLVGSVVARAVAYEGTRESPVGSNRQPFAAIAGHANGYAWCATFLVAVAKLSGLELPPGCTSAYTPTMEASFKRAGRLSQTPHPGSFGFVYFESMGRVAHVFMVTSVGDGYVNTIEGNSNTDGSRDGLEVVRHQRPILRSAHRTGVRSYGNPLYGSPPPAHRPTLTRYLREGNSGTAVVALQRKLGIRADGAFGPQTDRALRSWQHARHLSADGVVGPSTAHALGWEWKG